MWSRLFGRRETKESAVGAALVMTPGQPVWSPRDYAAFAREAYTQNVVAHRAVNAIADAVASVPWVAFRGETELTAHPLLDLLRDPNPQQSGPQYMRSKVGFFLLAGNGFEERVTVRGQVRELYQLRPDRMKIIPSERGVPAAYRYDVQGRQVRFEVDPSTLDSDVRHVKTFHPVDDWYGLSPVEAAAYAVDQHNLGMTWMQALLQNSARPSGALVTKDGGDLSDENFHRLKAQIEELYAGARNAGRPMLLEGGLDWRPMGLSPHDVGIVETKNSAARDIALAMGVPPQLLGIPGDNTYSNYQEARLAFWEDTVIPLLDLFAADWTAWLGDGVELRPDLDRVPAIADKQRELWAMVEQTNSLTINEKRERMGFEPIEGGDVLLVPMSQVPLGDAVAPPQEDPFADMDPEDVKALAYGDGKVAPLRRA